MEEMIIDTLEYARRAADSLKLIRQREIADSLHLHHLREIERATTHVFGEGSQLCEQSVERATALSSNLADVDVIYNIFAIVALLLYVLWLPKIVDGSAIKWAKLKHIGNAEEQGKAVAKQKVGLTSLTWGVGVTMLVALIIRFVNSAIELPWNWDMPLTLVAVYMVVVLLFLYGATLLKSIAYITLSSQFVDELLSIRRRMFILATLFVSPAILLFLLSTEEQSIYVVYMLIVEVIIIFGIFLFQTFLLFVRKNASILHWILYLCAIELFPITLMWGVISRVGLLP
ncbi:MAG: DUF4271 domain-containing protein [Rikenellaceae bacterium]